MSKSASTQIWVFIEILQNGVPISSLKKPFGKSDSVSITSFQKSGALSLPYYGAKINNKVLKIGRKSVSLILSLPWKGHISAKSTLTTVASQSAKASIYELVAGDFASIHFNDLKLIVRVGKDQKAILDQKIKRARGYNGKLSSLIFPDKFTMPAFLGALAVSTFFVGMCLIGISLRPIVRPQEFADLSETYSLPFIDPEHFLSTTEAMQKNLFISRYINSTVRYFSAMAKLTMGIEGYDKSLVFPTSATMYEKYHATKKAEQEQILYDQSKIDEKMSRFPRAALFAIPAIIGDDAYLAARTGIETIRSIHDAAKLNLDLRRKVIAQFAHDPPYDYKDYKAPLISEEATQALEKIRVWNTPREEEAIYMAGEALAVRAKTMQHGFEKPTVDVLISLDAANKFATFIPQSDFASFDRRLSSIQASQYGVNTNQKIREPLVGEIEPTLIEKVIEANRFELQLCFENALRRNKEIAGSMEWQWRIDSRGVIEELALLKSTIQDQLMINCIRKRITSWKFPRPRHGAVEIRYPFEFKPARG